MKAGSSNVISVQVIGFFTVLLIMTLNASSGLDLLDVTVAYIQSVTP